MKSEWAIILVGSNVYQILEDGLFVDLFLLAEKGEEYIEIFPVVTLSLTEVKVSFVFRKAEIVCFPFCPTRKSRRLAQEAFVRCQAGEPRVTLGKLLKGL